ncbi:MAG: aminotransferase class I/II-fold pyridoxal phosphate-dependent enzyme [Clostridia bacterium]
MLNLLKNNRKIPFHMPGHKRNTELSEFLKILRADLDITEIDGFDNLGEPEGILKKYMEKASKLWKSEKSFFLVGGSTCGILAGFKSLCDVGDTVLMAKNAHKSAYHAIELFSINTIFLNTEIYNSAGEKSVFDLCEFEKTIIENPQISLVFLTSPSYEGYILPIEKIRKIAHKYNIKLMVDEAHGSHLGFHPYFAGSAVLAKADLVVQSLHKTALGLTQTAILHINNGINEENVQNNINIFQSSSPSYLLLASICSCVDFFENSSQSFVNWKENLEFFYDKSDEFKHLKIIDDKEKDKSKILISTAKTNINGRELMSILREKYNIELEMAYADIALAMTGLGDTQETITELLKALLEIDDGLIFEEKEIFAYKNFAKKPEISINQAKKGIKKEIEIGEVSNKYMWIYPPGIPFLVPGEIYTKEVFEISEKLKKQGSEIIFK